MKGGIFSTFPSILPMPTFGTKAEVRRGVPPQAREHWEVLARDLLLSYGGVEMALFIVLRIKRTLEGPRSNDIISDVQARKARAIKLARRADCKRRELSARTFLAEIKSRG